MLRSVRETTRPIPAGLPSFAFPSTAFADVVRLLPAALGIFLVSLSDWIDRHRHTDGGVSPAVAGKAS